MSLTRSVLERDSVRSELKQSALGKHLLSDEALEQSRINALKTLRRGQALWIFGYGSLIWNPQMNVRSTERARIFGYQRALCLWSRINRGTPEQPGLVFGLMPGGSCAGLAFEIEAPRIEDETRLLWRREMLMGSYIPVWARAQLQEGRTVNALTFRVDRAANGYAGKLNEEQILATLRAAKGKFGTCSDYVCNTLAGLREHGIEDRRLARLCARLNGCGGG